MPKPSTPKSLTRSQQVARRLDDDLSEYGFPDVSEAQMSTLRDTGGYNVTREADEPPQSVKDIFAARTAAVRERAIAAGELGRDYAEERLNLGDYE
jgi:hypothetical protein